MTLLSDYYYVFNMTQRRIKFNKENQREFVQELREKVNSYFTNKGISTYGDYRLYIRAITMILLYVIPLTIAYMVALPWYGFLGMYILAGIGVTGIGCSVQHDANHGAFSRHDWVNNAFGFWLDIVGGSSHFWKIKHNVMHHTFTNIHGYDEDISVVKLIRMSPDAPHKFYHKYQHFFAWVLYAMLTLMWVFYTDFSKIWRYKANGSMLSNEGHSFGALFILFATKIAYLGYIIALPIFLGYSVGLVLLSFVCMHVLAGFILATTFQLAHVVEGAEFPLPNDKGMVEDAWYVHQLKTTSNFDTKNPLITYYVGGLNYQVEHHLFPKICSIHYPAISPIVKDTAEKYGIPYNENKYVLQAIGSHFRMLRDLGNPRS